MAFFVPSLVAGSYCLFLSTKSIALWKSQSSGILSHCSSALSNNGLIVLVNIAFALAAASTQIFDLLPAILNGDKPVTHLNGSLERVDKGLTRGLLLSAVSTVVIGLVSVRPALYACTADASSFDLGIVRP